MKSTDAENGQRDQSRTGEVTEVTQLLTKHAVSEDSLDQSDRNPTASRDGRVGVTAETASALTETEKSKRKHLTTLIGCRCPGARVRDDSGRSHLMRAQLGFLRSQPATPQFPRL